MKQRFGTHDRMRAAFTLIELLIVIALTALLLGLLFGPIIQGFKLTNKATALSRAQDATRYGLEVLNRELSEASYVFDNSTTPIVIPLAPTNPTGTSRISIYPGIYPKDSGGNDNPQPMYQYAKIDFIPSAIRTGAGTVIDPTTQAPLGGGDLRVPVAPNTRYLRYFIGLRNNIDNNNNPLYYDNVYEFPRTDDSLNPFIVWRAEYSPTDTNLINQNIADTNTTRNAGGLNDPNFFYNTTAAPNGRSYARNWREISSPVLSVPNLDVLAWRRDNRRQIDSNNPFQLTASFAPSSVNGDTATPGFITNTASEDPGAVPSLYTAQFGQWVLPYTITVFRGSTNYDSNNPRNQEPYGNLSFTVQPSAPDVNGNVTLQVVLSGYNGSLSTINSNNNYYWLYSPKTGKIFITTALTNFQIDPARGRIETAFPPLAANTASGAPVYITTSGNTAIMSPGPDGNTGELVETIYRTNTRDDAKIAAYPNVPKNQGITVAALGTLGGKYFPATQPLAPFTNGLGPHESPFISFGGANGGNYRSAIIVRGSERVMGPDNQLYLQPTAGTPTPDVTYFRVAQPPLARTARIAGAFSGVDSTGTPILTGGSYIQTSPLRYYLVSDLGNENAPFIQFDEDRGRLPTDVPGLPAVPAGTGSERDVRVTYMWQNNYSRNIGGEPVDANNRAATRDRDGNIRPEPDVMKVNYATRSLMNVSMGARVYDTSSGVPQVAQVSDRIKINNVAR